MAGVFGSAISVSVGHEGAGKTLQEEETARDRGDKARGDVAAGTVAEGHPEGHTLPLHPTAKQTVRTADGIIGREEDGRADRVGEAGDEGK